MSIKSMCLRAWRIPLRFAVVLLLPILALPLWLLSSAFVDYSKYASTAFGAPPISVDILRLFLHDGVVRERMKLDALSTRDDAPLQFDLRAYLDEQDIEYDRQLADEAVELPEVRLRVAPHHLVSLNSDLPTSGQTYVPATIETRQGLERGKVRYRGDTEPHWLYRQKSLRVKLRKGRGIFGTRYFNLINFLTPVPFIESVAQRLAAEAGLIAPRCFPVKVFFNEQYYGLLLFYDQVDEALLRHYSRMPGSIHRGDINFDEERGRKTMAVNPETGIGSLWEKPENWEKDGSRNAETEQDLRDLELMLQAVNSYDQIAFVDYCDTYLDNESFATFLAFNMFTGSPHHDFTHNHKLYFDPYRGKFEVISWDDKGFYGIKDIDPTLNPLANRWRESPLNEHLKHRRLWELLNSTFSTDRVLGILVALHETSEVAIRQDVNRDYVFYNEIFNKLSRPYSMKTYQWKLTKMVDNVRSRDEKLRKHLEDSRVRYSWKGGPEAGRIELAVVGPVGVKLTSIEIIGPGDSFELFRDSNLNEKLDVADDAVGATMLQPGGFRVVLEEPLHAGLKRIEHDKPRAFFGAHDFRESPLVYRYFFKADGPVSELRIGATNLVTGGEATVEEGPVAGHLEAETLSIHPWRLPAVPPQEVVTLGPGVVRFAETRIFNTSTEVRIVPGTTLELGQDVSLFFEGRVIARGSQEAPIRFVPQDAENPWGVVAVLGDRSSGSIFSYCRFAGGSVTERNLMYYSGMVSVRGSSKVAFENCFFGPNFVGDDTLHYAYSDGAVVDCEFKNARSDAFDVDISTLEVTRCRFLDSGNDGLDLMTSKAVVTSCEFRGSGDKGVSVGERTSVAIERSSFESCHIGVEVKDDSRAVMNRCTMTSSETPVNLYRKNLRYLHGGTLVIDRYSVGENSEAITSDGRSTVVVRDAHNR